MSGPLSWPVVLQLALIALTLAGVLSILVGSLQAGISPMPGSRRAHRAVLQMLEQQRDLDSQQTLTLIDCGSGWGHLVLRLARRYPHARVIGYEVSFLPWLTSCLLRRALRLNNLTLYRKNFLATELPVPLHQADLLFSYLCPPVMAQLAKRLKIPAAQLQVFSIAFALPGASPCAQQTLNDLYRTPIYHYRLKKAA